MPGPTPRWRALLGAFSTLVILSSTAPAAAAADEDTTPGPAPAVTNATILAAKTYPGVQLISTTYTATVTVAVPVLDQAALASLGQRIAGQAAIGSIDTTREAITEEIVDAVVKSPNTYFVVGGRTFSRRASLVGVGTGWVITPDGYIITAAHVVKSPAPQLRAEFANTALTKFGRQFVQGLQGSGISLTSDQVNRLTSTILDWLAVHMSVSRLNTSVSADIALSFDGLGKDQKPVQAEVVDVGKPYPGSDVALLKIDGQEHLPTIEVGSNDDVTPGSTVHVVGFPAASTFYAGLSRDSQVQPTVTEGPVTAIKSTPSGMPVIQTQAPASPGNSGGPVVTEGGQSVGVLVANAVGSDGVAAQGQNFVIPASEVLDMLERNGVSPQESDTTATYDKAVDEFYADHFSAALPLFEKVETLYPAHPFAQKFITDSKTAIDEGRDKTPEPSPWGRRLLLGGLIAGGLVLLAGLGILIGVQAARSASRRQAARPVAAPAGYPQPAEAQRYAAAAYQPAYQGQPPAWGPASPPAYPYPQQGMASDGHDPRFHAAAPWTEEEPPPEEPEPLWRGPDEDPDRT